MTDLNLGVVGNGQIAALVDERATVVWACLPRFDGDPFFCRLLRAKGEHEAPGFLEVQLADFARAEQHYLPNTAILRTTLYDRHGGAVAVTDLAPRYPYVGRIFKPTMLIRALEPVAGSPRIRIRIRPACNYGARGCETTHGSNHIRYLTPDQAVRLTTDVSITRLLEESPFIVDRPLHLVLGPDETVRESVADAYYENLRATRDYWQNWVRGLAIPFEWQSEVIRAAITLKLCNFEDTGAIIAAMTTSIPEAAGSGRNWDYRYCWLRDAYFVVQALNRLGATRTMESFINYIINVAAEADGQLQPVYSISGRADIVEREVETLSGYRGMGPVRVGNQAHEQKQNDVYGAVVLAATQLFFDQRLANPGTVQQFERLEQLGEKAVALHDQPDAGLWEYRGRQRVHTFSSLMCWAACDRLARIAERLGLPERVARWRGHAQQIRVVINERAWHSEKGAFTESFGRPEMDASLLTMHELGFLPAGDPRFVGTVEAIGRELRRGKHLFRYAAADDFGDPENAFNICTFWYIDALATIGRREEARELFENMLACRNPLGLLSEDIDPDTNALWGNFPQTYSMAGIINVATRLSRPWGEVI